MDAKFFAFICLALLNLGYSSGSLSPSDNDVPHQLAIVNYCREHLNEFRYAIRTAAERNTIQRHSFPCSVVYEGYPFEKRKVTLHILLFGSKQEQDEYVKTVSSDASEFFGKYVISTLECLEKHKCKINEKVAKAVVKMHEIIFNISWAISLEYTLENYNCKDFSGLMSIIDGNCIFSRVNHQVIQCIAFCLSEVCGCGFEEPDDVPGDMKEYIHCAILGDESEMSGPIHQ